MIGVKVSDRRLDTVEVLGGEPATRVKVGGNQSHAMHDAADAPDHHEFDPVLLEAQQQGFILLNYAATGVRGPP